MSTELALGPHFIGMVLAMIFYGVSIAQTFAYFRAYGADPRLMKAIVFLLLYANASTQSLCLIILSVLDTAQVSLVAASLYEYAVRWRGNEAMLQYVSHPFIASMGITCVVAFTVQMIYAYRIWRLSGRNAYLTTAIVALAFVALASSAAMAGKILRNPRWDEARVNDVPAGLILASTVMCDLLIAFSQVWLFQRHRLARLEGEPTTKAGPFSLRRSGSLSSPAATEAGCASPPRNTTNTGSWMRLGSQAEAPDNGSCGKLGPLITTLSVLVINVGLLTSFDATLFVALFLACPQTGVYLVPYILLSNCYVNSFLSILNSRRVLRDLVENPELRFPVTFDFALDAG
ncbi:hypothetical protein HMN09_01142100 [Mycena chlorophos]|uniref:DUF6534 domain-containing protein n=1 Tax=Mycena chlorophos TaxID=658473 RepID=A0A8H6VU79_MYCCL|nr:hypothetical protein HMN09_01142100 [Mycena chlorophos]